MNYIKLQKLNYIREKNKQLKIAENKIISMLKEAVLKIN